jgi:predicted metalloprotease with PDZ domain
MQKESDMISRAVTSVCAVVFVAAAASANMAPPRDFYLGISVVSSPDGAKVNGLARGSSAGAAGLQVGDIIVGADKRWTKAMTADELKAYVEGPHWFAELIVVRGGKTVETIQVRR